VTAVAVLMFKRVVDVDLHAMRCRCARETLLAAKVQDVDRVQASSTVFSTRCLFCGVVRPPVTDTVAPNDAAPLLEFAEAVTSHGNT